MSYSTPPGGESYSLPNSNMAVVSLIAGILGLTLIPLVGSVIAIITGMMARREIREGGGTMGGDGLATAGLVLGWIGVGLGVIGICAFGAIFALIPFCALLFNTTSSSGLLAPTLLAVLF
jgi:hypothetical protein